MNVGGRHHVRPHREQLRRLLRGRLDFNVQRLDYRWFERGVSTDVDELLIHEFGHQYSGDHLSDEYHEALCRLGARLKRLALEKPEEVHGYTKE